MNAVDMSPEAVSRRLREVDELRELCLALAGPRLKRPWGVPEAAQAESQPDVPTPPQSGSQPKSAK